MSNYNKSNTIVNRLFALMLFSAIISYAYHALATLNSGGYVLWTYSNLEINVGIVGKIMLYLKDITAAILVLILSVKNMKISRITLYFAAIVLYGIIVLGLSGSFNIMFIIGGIRAYLFFLAALLYFDFRKRSISGVQSHMIKLYLKFDRHCLIILQGLIFFEFFVVLLQVFNSGVSEIGSGAYRYTGTFGNAGGLGNYCMGMTMILIAYSVKMNYRNICIRILEFLMLIFNVWASGMRSAIFMVLLLIAAYTLAYLYEELHIKKSSLFPIFIIVCLIAGSGVYSTVIKSIGRGNLMQSGGTRISLFCSLFDQNIVQVIFGQGIGKGTNSAVNLGIEGSVIYDGTFTTIMAQYGLLGLSGFCFVLIKTVFEIIGKSGVNWFFASVMFVPIGIIMISGNYFEQFAFVILSLYSFYILTAEEYN